MKIIEVKHPLIQHKLGLMRDINIENKIFRELSEDISSLLTYIASSNIKTDNIVINNWCGTLKVKHIEEEKITIVPILRAGLGMMNGALKCFPNAKVGMVGIYRNEKTLLPVSYFKKLVSCINNQIAIVVDPMLATGGSIVSTVNLLKKLGYKIIKILVLVASPQGINFLKKKHSDVELYTASIDLGLNKKGYIIPGLGDAGDKMFGKK
ncbi:MAG: uracil phosphoribosyltransferase [Enterobacteriaceae bacterium]